MAAPPNSTKETAANHRGLTFAPYLHLLREGATVRPGVGGGQALYFVEEEMKAERGSDLSTTPQKGRAWPRGSPDGGPLAAPIHGPGKVGSGH